jgi:predicted nucleotidyltransferase
MVASEKINELAHRIIQKFKPEKIILFGSYAYGNPSDDSDVDLLVLLNFKGQGFRKALEILNNVDPHFAVDLLARTPADAQKRYQEGDPRIRMAVDYGKVLYERDS